MECVKPHLHPEGVAAIGFDFSNPNVLRIVEKLLLTYKSRKKCKFFFCGYFRLWTLKSAFHFLVHKAVSCEGIPAQP